MEFLENNHFALEKNKFNKIMNEIIFEKINSNEIVLEESNNFMHNDNSEILPISVMSNISPTNT